MNTNTDILCAECQNWMPDTEPCPACERKVGDKCSDPMSGVCLRCPEPVDHEGQPIPVPGVLAEQTANVLQAVDRRIDAYNREQAIKRAQHLDTIKMLLAEHRSDVFSDVAKLMQANEVTT